MIFKKDKWLEIEENGNHVTSTAVTLKEDTCYATQLAYTIIKQTDIEMEAKITSDKFQKLPLNWTFT